MERQKRVYPARNMKWYMCILLLTVAVMVGYSGLFPKERNDGFSLQAAPAPSAVPLNEAFDETYTTLEFTIPSSQWYALQLASFENQENAEEFSKVYQRRGAAGYLWNDERYRVLAAAYPLRDDAQLVRNQLMEQHTVDSHLFLIDFPAVKLRVTGMQGQLEILQAAFLHAHDLASDLQSLSVAIDRNEVSVNTVLDRVSALNEQIEIVILRFNQRYAGQKPTVVAELLHLFESHLSASKDFSANESLIVIGMQLKYQTLSVLKELHDIYMLLNNT